MNKPLIAIAFAAVLLCFSCSKTATTDVKDAPATPPVATDGFKTYIIPKGSHYATENPYTAVGGNSLAFDVIFDSSSMYATISPENQADINKLYGFADCGTTHQVNSARFGWNWQDNQLRLYAYCYVNNERISKYLGNIPLNAVQHCRITAGANTYTFELNGVTTTLNRHCNSAIAGYKLYPYFGGDETAPHEVKIKVKEL
jgi:hypothetical protein